MPICQYCGRQLAEGEVCYCQQQNAAPQQGVPYPNPAQQNAPYPQNPNQYQNPQNPYPNQYQNPQNPYPNQYQNPQNPYPNQYQNPNGQPPKKKGMSTGCLVALIIGIVLLVITLIVGAILAAILVPSMMGYVKKSKVSSANAAAKNYYEAAQTALVELDSRNQKLGGTYMISSAGSQGVPFDEAEFKSYCMNNVPSEMSGYSYVFVIENGYCIYAAIEDDGSVGSYPRAVTTTGAYDCNDEFYDFSDISFDKMVDAARTYVADADASGCFDDELDNYNGDYSYSYSYD